MTNLDSRTPPVDADEVLAVLAAYWADPKPSRWGGGIPRCIAGSEYDQIVSEGASNPYWEIVRRLPCDAFRSRMFPGGQPEPDAYFFDVQSTDRMLTDRGHLCATFSWSIPSPGDIAWITEGLAGRGIVEPGAGGGYWAWQLAQAGADVVAYEPEDPADNKFVTGEPWYPVLRGDHGETARHPGRSLLLCWPSYAEPWAAWSLATYKGDQLFYAGAGVGGCCADDEFFSLLAAEWEDAGDSPAHVTFSGIHCYLTEYRRKAQPGSAR
ncbi:MAG: hypothetical protein M3Y33_08580 [Actinomycetota bacterium]|nr:hypothetical protein [Actinomycetota bacterium]